MAESDLYDAGLCGIDEVQDALVAYFDRKVGHLRVTMFQRGSGPLEWFSGGDKTSIRNE